MQDHDRVYHVVCDRYHVVRTFELGTCKYMLAAKLIILQQVQECPFSNPELVQQPGVGCLFR
jgi:hypothetical protein